MKLTAMEKSDRKFFLNLFRANGGELFSFPADGVTIAVAPACESQDTDSRFVYIAVAYCNFKGDVFKRKRGEYLALDRWYGCTRICVPRNGRTNAGIASSFAEFCG